MAAGRPRGRPHPDLGGALGPAPQRRAVRAVALQDAAGGEPAGARPRTADGDDRIGLARVCGFHALPPARHQTHVRLFLDRAYGHYHLRVRHGRPARQLRGPPAHDHALADQVGDLLRGRSRRAGQGHPAHRRHGRLDRDQSGARLGPGARRRRDRRAAAARHLHQRVPGGELDLRTRAVACGRAGVRAPGRFGGAVLAAQHSRVRRAARPDRESRGLLRAHVRPPRPGAGRRDLPAAGAGALVPERGEAARIDPACRSNASQAVASKRTIRIPASW